MGILSGETWFSGMGSGGGDPGPDYREEIPAWFFDHCYKVVKVKGYHSEEDIPRYQPAWRDELRARRSYPLGSVLCYLRSQEVRVISEEEWRRWQSILVVPSHIAPQRGLAMAANSSDRFATEWWFTPGATRERVLCSNEDLMSALFSDGA